MPETKIINLWECLTKAQRSHEKDGGYPEVTGDDLQALARTSRFHMQEISVQAVAEGWLLGIFSPSPDGPGGDIRILIPKDHREAVKVCNDVVGRRIYQHEDI